MNIQRLIDAKYVATPADIEALAASVVAGKGADGTYLRVLTGLARVKLGAPRRGKVAQDAQVAAVDDAHADAYAAVLRGVGDDNTTDAERQRRATFARTAASTLRAYAKHGGDLRALDVLAVTKGSLRAAVAPHVDVPEGTTRKALSFDKAMAGVARIAGKLVKADGEGARERIEEAIATLEAALDAIPRATRRASSRPLHRTNGDAPRLNA